MSNFVVSARKYRPNRFEDVVGQEHVSQTLKNALQNDHLAHAFLFCGPRGVGKTTCARILAKVLNCQAVTEDFEPCNTCDSCKAFAQNASFNIIELDAASNNSVDHIRQLVEQVRFQPQQGKYKIFIIDEVHMLSQAAFNAFLKTLEEPPPYAIFILATTEKHKIIPTILSRCQIFDFKRIQVANMVAHLQGICEQEGIDADKDALHIVAQKADGALRDALSIFDRIVSFSGKKITYEDVITNLNVLDYDYFFKFTDALLTENVSNVLLIFDDILKKGFEADIFINGFAEHLRNILVCKNPQTLQLLEVSDNLKTRYQTQANISPTTFLLTALNLANECDVNYKMARNKRLHVEMALIKMAYISRAVHVAKNPQTVAAAPEKKTLDQSVSVPTTPIVAASAATPAPPVAPVASTPTVSAPITPPATPNEPTVLIAQEPEPEPLTPPNPAEKVAAKVEQIAEEKTIKSALPKRKLGLGGGGFSMDLDALDEEVKEETTEESKKEVVEIPKLELEKLQVAWNDYLPKCESDSTRNILKSVELAVVDESAFKVKVSSTLAQGAVQQEYALMAFLQNALNIPVLSREIEIDKSKIATTAPKRTVILGKGEKYNQMKDENPLVDELRIKMDLTWDE